MSSASLGLRSFALRSTTGSPSSSCHMPTLVLIEGDCLLSYSLLDDVVAISPMADDAEPVIIVPLAHESAQLACRLTPVFTARRFRGWMRKRHMPADSTEDVIPASVDIQSSVH